MDLTRYIIKKASGEGDHFSPDKLKSSLARAGAASDVTESILNELSDRLYDGITTKKIYQIAFSLLKKEQKPLAARYKLKQGIMELGPSGFPFEKFIGEILKTMGYQVQVGVFLDGKCVKHEVDVLAKKNNEISIIECKYHNRAGFTCDVKTPLYVHSRFRDIESGMMNADKTGTPVYTGWLVTNTKFTSDAIKYGLCSGLRLLSWDFPKNSSLRELIDKAGLYPLTCLTTLTRVEKQRLLDRKIVLCKELSTNENLLRNAYIGEPRLKNIMKEALALSKGNELRN